MHLPVFSMLVRVYEGSRVAGQAPDYYEGVYSNYMYDLYPNEEALIELYSQKQKFGVKEIFQVMYEDIVKLDPKIKVATNGGQNSTQLLEYVERNYSKNEETGLLDDLENYQMKGTDGLFVSVDAVYESSETGSGTVNSEMLMVLVFIMHEGADFDPLLDSVPFIALNWELSTETVVVFGEGFQFMSTQKMDGSGSNVPQSLLFNLIAVSFKENSIEMNSKGFSVLPLNTSEIGSLQGYFQLPIYDYPVDLQDIEAMRGKNQWALTKSFGQSGSKFKWMGSSLLVRLHLQGFEVLGVDVGVAQQPVRIRPP